MTLVGQGRQSSCDLLQTRPDVRTGGPDIAAAVGVPGVRPRHGIPEVSLDPGQRRVPQPVRADLLHVHPRQVLTDSHPQVVVAPLGDRLPVAVTQQLPRSRRLALLGMLLQMPHQRR